LLSVKWSTWAIIRARVNNSRNYEASLFMVQTIQNKKYLEDLMILDKNIRLSPYLIDLNK
jgi:hypothetical protein